MAIDSNRREFIGICAAIAAGSMLAAGVRPQAACAQDKTKYLVATLGKIKDLNEKDPQLVKAEFLDDTGKVAEEEKLFVRWVRTGKNSGYWVVVSAICTHLKCKVDFASDDHIFICPCHGSRFDLSGAVLRKPAKTPLPDYSDMAYEDGSLLKLKRVVS